MLNENSHASILSNAIQDLSIEEINSVAGGWEGYQGYSRSDGGSFSWTGPNGIVYHDVVFAGTHFLAFADGSQEWYHDIFAVSSIPLSTGFGMLNSSYSYNVVRYYNGLGG